MNFTFILPVIIFAFSMSITPGPNNLLLTISGTKFGYKRTFPHILGILSGIALLNFLCAIGFYKLFDIIPWLQKIMGYLGASYMLYLSFKIAISGKIKNGSQLNNPISFTQALLFQALNPKALLMSLTAITAYSKSGDLYLQSVIYIIITFIIVGFPSISTWAIFGTILKKLLSNQKYANIFNNVMALLCIFSAIILII